MSATPSRPADVAVCPPVRTAATPRPAGEASPGVRADGRLGVRYALNLAPGEDAAGKAELIAFEQTVELPRALLEPALAQRMAGRVEAVQPIGPRRALVELSFSLEAVGDDLPQCLNLLFGNISLKPGIRIVGLDWPAGLLAGLGGPGHGITGLRTLTGVHGRAL